MATWVQEKNLPPLPGPVLGGPTCPSLGRGRLVLILGRKVIPSFELPWCQWQPRTQPLPNSQVRKLFP